MFFKSIISGIALMRFWQVWVAVLFYVVCNFLFIYFNASLVGDSNKQSRFIMAFFSSMIGGLIVQAILMGIIIAFLLPILFGGNSASPFGVIFENIGEIILAGGIAVFIVTILCITPILGQIIANSSGLQNFLEGVIILRIFSDHYINTILSRNSISYSVYPGFWQSIGYLIISWLITHAVIIGMIFLVALIESKYQNGELTKLVSFFGGGLMGILGGLLPVFMYAQYIALSVR